MVPAEAPPESLPWFSSQRRVAVTPPGGTKSYQTTGPPEGVSSQGSSFALLVLSFLSCVHSHPPLLHVGSEVPWWPVRWEAAYHAQA